MANKIQRWTDEEVDYLCELNQKYETYEELIQLMSEKFGYPFSRERIRGKLKNLGLNGVYKKRTTKKPKKKYEWTDTQRQLCEENYNLIYGFMHRYCVDDRDYDEIEFYATQGYLYACLSFDPSKAKFSGYAYKCMYNESVKFWKQKKEQQKLVYLDQQDEEFAESIANLMVSDDYTAENLLIDNERDDLFKRIDKILTKYEKRRDTKSEVVHCRRLVERMRLGLSQEEYARHAKISQVTVSNSEVKAIKILKKDKRLIKLYKEWMSYEKND